MTTGSKAASGTFGVANHKATITLDDNAFPCAVHSRVNGRAQTVLYGTLSGKGYKTGGIPCDFTAITNPGKFPLGNFRVVVQPDTTCNYYAVYDHAAKKLKIYSSLSGQLANGTVITGLVFPFLAVGE
jgi:hypothetical protein